MARRELLTAVERQELLADPGNEVERNRLYTLTKPDLAFVRHHRADHNRLGIAVQLKGGLTFHQRLLTALRVHRR